VAKRTTAKATKQTTRPRAKAVTRSAPEPPKTALMLRTCAADMTAHGGFRWPESGPVECPDWDPTPECGHGLHGLLWGRGDYSLLSSAHDAKWLVVEIDPATAVEIGSKIKVPRGTVVYCGHSRGALAMLRGARWGLGQATTNEASSTGDAAHASSTGDAAHASSTGDAAHASSTGYAAHASSTGDYAHASSTGTAAHASSTGDYAHASSTGDYAHASSTGTAAHASSTGDYAHASSTGDYAHASSTGYAAHASSTGDAAHASSAGSASIAACLGLDGCVKAHAVGAPLVCSYLDTKWQLRVAVAYVGEAGIKPDVWYRVNATGVWVEV